jgi:hypothetical protein
MLAKKTFKENNDGLHLLSLIAILIESLIKENSKDKRAKAVNEGITTLQFLRHSPRLLPNISKR